MDVIDEDVEQLTNSELSNDEVVPGPSQACSPPSRKRGTSIAEIDHHSLASSKLLRLQRNSPLAIFD